MALPQIDGMFNKKNLTVLAWSNPASAIYMEMNRHGRIIFGDCP
jgi:hypothetical protein